MRKRPLPEISREDFDNALKELDSYMDVTADDVLHINRMAQRHAWLRQVEDMRVRNVMTTEVVSVTPDTSLQQAARTLLELRVSGLPVVDDDNKVVGIITEADFLTALGIPEHHPHSIWHTLEHLFKHPPERERLPERVSEIMEQKVISITADSTVHEVIDKMKQYDIKRVIVTDENNQLKGIVTRSNLIQVMLHHLL